MSEFPNFMVVGGVKCGTTSLYYYMQSHPEICAPCKESYLFTPELNQETTASAKRYSLDEYMSLFKKSVTDQTRAAGEISSIYLYCHEEVIPEIKRLLGDIKIIIVLRNPVGRAFSHYSFFARDVRDERTFEDAVNEELNGQAIPRPRHYLKMGLYSHQLKAYLDNFSTVKVILFDDLVADPDKTMRDIYTYLGVNPDLGGSTDKVYNASGMPRVKWLQSLVFKPTPLKMKIRGFIVNRLIREERFAQWMEWARKKNMKKAALSPDMKKRLTAYYREDIQALESLLGKDLSVWKDP